MANSFLSAADLHNTAAGQGSWTDGLSEGLSYGLAATAIVAGKGIYDSAVDVVNFFGGDIQTEDNYAFMSSIDSDLAGYYAQHKAGIDAAGFIAGSLVPGMVGVKALNGAQTMLRASMAGYGGRTGSMITGILAPSLDVYRKTAKAEIALGTEKFAISNKNVVKALTGGAVQNVWEGAAFEAFALAAQYKAPVLTDLDGSTIAKDFAFNAALGGVIGGTFSAIKTVYGVKNATTAIDKSLHKYFEVTEVAALKDGEQLTHFSDQLARLPQAPSAEDFLLGKVPGATSLLDSLEKVSHATPVQKELAESLANKYAQERKRVAGQLELAARGKFTALAQGDTELSEIMHTMWRTNPVSGDAFMNTERIVRLGELTALDTKKFADRYVSLVGENAGLAASGSQVKASAWRVADAFKAKELPGAIKAYKFKPDSTIDYASLDGIDNLKADARNIWARTLTRADFDVPEGRIIHENDIPMLRRARELGVEVRVISDSSSGLITLRPKDVAAEIPAAIQRVVREQAGKIPADEIAHRLDAPLAFIEGADDPAFAAAGYSQTRIASSDYSHLKRISGELQGLDELDVGVLPSIAVVRDRVVPLTSEFYGDPFLKHFQVSAAADIAARQKVAKHIRDTALPSVLGEFFQRYAPMDVTTVSRNGTGAGLLAKANANYGSAGSVAQHAGLITEKALGQIPEKVAEHFKHVGATLLQDVPVAGGTFVETATYKGAMLGSIDEAVRRSAVPWVRMQLDDGTQALVRKSVADRAAKTGNTVHSLDDLEQLFKDYEPSQLGDKAVLKIESEGVASFIDSHIKRRDEFIQKEIALDKARGLDSVERWSSRQGVFYPPPINPRRTPNYVFVEDSRLGTSEAGRVTMLHAPNASSLQRIVDDVRARHPHLRVYTGPEAEKFYEAAGKYEYERTMHTAGVNHELKSSGISSSAIPTTDPQALLEDYVGFHVAQEQQQYREGVKALYLDEFAQLAKIDEVYSNLALSTKDAAGKAAAKGASPGEELVRLALAVPKKHALWNGLDDAVNRTAATFLDKLGAASASVKSPEDLKLVNSIMDEYGVNTAAQGALSHAWANHRAGSKPITNFVRSVNGALANLMLGFDPINAVTNAISSTTLRSTELQSLLGAIAKKDPEAAGKLFMLDVEGVKTLSPAKMQARAYADFTSMGEKHPWYAQFKDMGIIKEAHETQVALVEAATLTGEETAAQLLKKESQLVELSKKLAETGRNVTGNNLAERMNRFVSAHVMKQVTELAEKQGLLTPKESLAYISTFVNRTEGTLVVSQRPVIFNGAIGSALSLFQTYQFNFIQQMLRHVGNSDTKATAYMLGLQGSIFGMNGLPGFHQLNQAIIGSQSSNPQHRDAYDIAYGTLGKQAGEILMYGVPSNIMQAAIYTRGDLNPRSPVLLPTSIAEVPAVGMITKAFKAVKATWNEAAGTGNIGAAILTGLEQNGLNRPIAGLATLTKGLAFGEDGKLQVTTALGKERFESELYSFAQLWRLAGARPLDEGVAMDALYRVKAYTTQDNEAKTALATNIRRALSSNTFTGSEVEDASAWFAARGHSQKQFARWYAGIVKDSSESEVEALTGAAKSPMAYKMQLIMGGTP